MRARMLLVLCSLVLGCAPYIDTTPRTEVKTGESETHELTFYYATYHMSLASVERPAKATERYGAQRIDIQSINKKYGFQFEDNLVRVLWSANSRSISFLLQNKTDHSIKIPWDEAAFVDEYGRSHRVMHAGVKYTDRENPQAPSVVVRQGSIEDIVFPTDYVHYQEGTRYSAGKWVEKQLFFDLDSHGPYTHGTYSSFADFSNAVRMYIGKTLQVLLPLQIEDVINDYIFTFRVDSVATSQETRTF